MTDQQGQRLAEFVRQNQASIVKEWVEFARSISPASDKMSKLALEDHIFDILGFVADDLESAQTPRERFDKSRGKGPKEGPFSDSAAEIHAALRLADGFDIDQMVSEYRALRASVVKLWLKHNQALANSDIEDLTRTVRKTVVADRPSFEQRVNRPPHLILSDNVAARGDNDVVCLHLGDEAELNQRIV